MSASDIMGLIEAKPYRDHYRVTADGQVWSCLTGRWVCLRPSSSSGYSRVSIRIGAGVFKAMKVARIVCEVFHGPCPPDKCLVRHLNGISTDDRAANLAWGTGSENAMDAVRHGTSAGAKNGRLNSGKFGGDKSHFARLDWEKVRRIRDKRANGISLSIIAEEFSVDIKTISDIGSGKSWKEPGAILTPGVQAPRKPYLHWTVRRMRERAGGSQ